MRFLATGLSSSSSVSKTLASFIICAAVLLPNKLLADATSTTSSDSSDKNTAQQLQLVERLIYKENYPAAIKKLKQAIKADKENADAWNLLGFASRKSGDTEAAKHAYEMALSIDKEHLGALEYQGELFITMGKLDSAQENLARLTKLCPDGCDQQEELANALAKTN